MSSAHDDYKLMIAVTDDGTLDTVFIVTCESCGESWEERYDSTAFYDEDDDKRMDDMELEESVREELEEAHSMICSATA